MGRGRLFRLGGLATVLALAVACSAASGSVRGVVLDVEGSLNDVPAFTVLVEGARLRFLTTEEGEYAFALGHLRDHLRSGSAVVVEWELVDGDRVAVAIGDG